MPHAQFLQQNVKFRTWSMSQLSQDYCARMMIKLRLKRYGKKRETSYRIVAMNSSTRRDGRPLEELGFYNPRNNETRLDVPAIVKRLQQGAQPTDTVRDILRKANVFEQLGAGANLESSTAAVS
jgi:small subunit ribosomal protein S16